MCYLAIDVGGTFTKYALMDKNGAILSKDKIPTVPDDFDGFINSVSEVYNICRSSSDIAGIALSMPGLIDSKSGFIYTGGNITCIDSVNIAEVIEKSCGVRTTVENDAKCAALAELWRGSLTDCKDAVVMVCGTGIGGAVIKDRKIISGSHCMAGEFSYTDINADSNYSLDNSFAAKAGIKALMKYVSEETSIPAEELDGIKVFKLANNGDKRAAAGIRRYVKNIAVQIHNYQFIIDPEKFAVGGGISVEPMFIAMIREELAKINAVYPWKLPVPKVTACKFFNDANLIGALYVHLSGAA